MEPSLLVSLAAAVVSGCALFASTYLTAHQIKLSRQALQVTSFYNFMSDFRQAEFHHNFNYVTKELQIEHNPRLKDENDPSSGEVGVYDIPEPAFTKVIDTMYFYQNAASFAGFGLMDEDKVIAFLQMRLITVWAALQPYVLAERKKNAAARKLCTRLEAYAERAAEIDPDAALEAFKRVRRMREAAPTPNKVSATAKPTP